MRNGSEHEQPHGRARLVETVSGDRHTEIAGDLGLELLIAGGHPPIGDDALSIFAP